MQFWQTCLEKLQQALPSQEFMTWVQPLKAEYKNDCLYLIAPNHFISTWVRDKYFDLISEIFAEQNANLICNVKITHVGASDFDKTSSVDKKQDTIKTQLEVKKTPQVNLTNSFKIEEKTKNKPQKNSEKINISNFKNGLNSKYTFDTFVSGQSNQFAHAAAQQVSENPGSCNPLFIYGGVGLGKTHLMHAVGNRLKQKDKNIKVLYIYSETFVQKMVNAMRIGAMNDFKQYYRNLDVLLIDDIQFFAGKDRSQEEIFHTLNSMLDGEQQIIMTCDRYPKDITGLEDRLKSRLSWGLTVTIDPPELETRVAILKKKAEEANQYLSDECAFFIAQKVRSHVRDLEGALRSVFAYANFKDKEASIPIIKEALKDLLASQNRQISIDNIQRTVAEYYKIKLSELSSKSRVRSIVRPRQMAMTLSKELTNHSLPEIGDAFGGKDHTTVLHANRTIAKLKQQSPDIMEDYKNLLRILTT